MEVLSSLKKIGHTAREKIILAPTVETRLMRNKHYDWYEAKVNEKFYTKTTRYPGGTVTTISPSQYSLPVLIGIDAHYVCIRHAISTNSEPVEDVMIELGTVAIIGKNSSRLYGIEHDGTFPERFFSYEPEERLRQSLEKLACQLEPYLPSRRTLINDYNMTMDAIHIIFNRQYRT